MSENTITCEDVKRVLLTLADKDRYNPGVHEMEGCFYTWPEDNERHGKPACLAANALVALGLSLPSMAQNKETVYGLTGVGMWPELTLDAAGLLYDAQHIADDGRDWAAAVAAALEMW